MKKCFSLLIVCYLFSVTLQAQSTSVKTPYTNGEIKALASYGDTVFVGGNFNKVYSYERSSENIAMLDTLNGQHIPLKLSVTGGEITKIIKDERGTGFYIGGTFTSVGDSARSGVAHLDSLGRVTSRLRTWKIMTHATINDMALRGDTLLVAGDYFSDIYSKPINALMGVNPSNFTPNNSNLPEVNGVINAMVIDAMGMRYICGNFTRVGNQNRNKLAKIDSNGNVLPWNPIITSGDVNTLCLNGTTIIIGGKFHSLNGMPRNSIAEVDTSSGQTVTNLDAKPLQGGKLCSIFSIAKWLNNIVIAGDFTSVGDSARAGAAIIDLTTGRATARLITEPALASFVSKVIVGGNQLYLIGIFSLTGNGQERISSINLLTGSISSLPFLSNFSPTDILINGNTLYVSGGGSLVVVNVTTNTLITQFNVLPNELVGSMILQNGILYLAGNFSQVSGNPRNGLASIDIATNTLTSSFSNTAIFRSVSLLGVSNNRLLVNGALREDFAQFNNNRYNTSILAYHTASDSLFNIPHQIIGPIKSLLISNDTLFICGQDLTIYGRNRGVDSVRNNFAAISLVNYNVLSPSIVGISGIYNAMVKRNNEVIIGGSFGSHPSCLFSINLNTNVISTYSRPQTGQIYQMCLVNNQLYLGGSFLISGNPTGLISTSALPTGSNTSWSTDITFCPAMFAYRNKLYIQGGYAINAVSISQIRTFNIPTNNSVAPTLLSSRNIELTNGWIASFADLGNRIMAAGYFTFLGGSLNARGLFAYQRSTGRVISPNLSINTSGQINTLAVFQNTLFVGGSFDSINAISRRNFASVNINTCSVTTWNPIPNGQVKVMHIVDSNLFVAGDFNAILGQTRFYFALINLPSGTLNSWNPSGGGNFISDIKSNNTSIFFAGAFSSFNGKPMNSLFSINRRTLVHDSLWIPTAQNPLLATSLIYSINVINNHVYIVHSTNTENVLLKVNTLTGLMPKEWSYPKLGTSKICFPYKSGLISSISLIDTLQGNRSRMISLLVPDVWFTSNAALIFENKCLFGGPPIFAGRINLYEYDLSSESSLRMEVSDTKICKGRSFTVKLSGVDSLSRGDYLISIDDIPQGSISVPNRLECTFTLPNTFWVGNGQTLTATFGNKYLEVTNKVNVGNTPSKEILLSQNPVLCTGKTLAITYADSSNRLIHKYKWFRNDTVIAGATQYRLNAITQTGNYRGIVESEIGCADTTANVAVLNTGLCQAPTISARDLRFTTVVSGAVALSWRNGNGTRRIVLAKVDTAVNATPSYGVTYNGSPAFGFGDSLGFRNYTVYNGNNNQCTVDRLIAGRRYHFAVIEYNETGASTSYQSGPYLIGSITMPATTYYNKATGNVNVLSTWGTNMDGTGTAPTNFAIPAFYNIRNGTSPTLSGNWQLDSNGSVISVGVGSSTPPLQFTIPSGMAVTCGNFSVNGNHILTVSGELRSQFVEGLDTSLCIWNGTTPQIIPEAKFGRLNLSGGEKLATGKIWVTDTLRLDAILRMQADTFTLGTQFFPFGPLVRTGGFIAGPMNRWLRNTVSAGTNGLLPVGRNNKYMPIQLNFTAVPSGLGNILVTAQAMDENPTNAGLPLIEGGVTIKSAGKNGYWKLLNTANRSGLNFNLIASALNYDGVSNSATTRLITRSTGANWQTFGSAGIVSGTNSSFTITKNSVTSFGEFAIGGDSVLNPLPSELIYFDAYKNGNQSAKIFWQTASEINSDYFEIQRSIDAIQFEPIGAVNAAGNSSVVRNYEFIDAKLQQEGTYYYRLRMIDKDGSEAHSQVVSVNMEMEQTVQIYPNPVKNILTIEGATGMIYIYSSTGLQMIPPTIKNKIDVSEFPQGLYIIQTGDSHIKFVKQ